MAPNHDSQSSHGGNKSPESHQLNNIIKRFGGRHLIFRTSGGGWRITPRPYVLVSSFRGPIWVFYGAGQIWLTHKKIREFGGWMARAPRLANKQIVNILNEIEPELTNFIGFCNEHGIEGTIVIDSKVIEFHWTFGDELDFEKLKSENKLPLESQFQILCDRYLIVKAESNV